MFPPWKVSPTPPAARRASGQAGKPSHEVTSPICEEPEVRSRRGSATRTGGGLHQMVPAGKSAGGAPPATATSPLVGKPSQDPNSPIWRYRAPTPSWVSQAPVAGGPPDVPRAGMPASRPPGTTNRAPTGSPSSPPAPPSACQRVVIGSRGQRRGRLVEVRCRGGCRARRRRCRRSWRGCGPRRRRCRGARAAGRRGCRGRRGRRGRRRGRGR